jgi:hypothetical protein
MAIGDIAGDLATAWMTPAQRAAKNGAQSLTGGPIARASDQLPRPASLADAAPAVAAQAQQSMQLVTQPASLADAWPKQTSFDATNTAPKYLPQQPQSLASLSPTAPSSQQPTPVAQQPTSLADLRPGGAVVANDSTAPQQSVGLDSGFRLTGVGSGSNAIAARIGADGAPEFSNQSTDLASASRQAPISQAPQQTLADAWRNSAPGSGAQFAALGSASNIGDGIGGGLSVGAPGDSQLALTRFQRANDIRALGAAQDRADLANYRANQGAQIGIVRDSSRPLTRSDLAAAQLDEQRQAGLVQNAGRAQQSLEDLRSGITAATQTRQANRLEDALTMATAPNATDAARQNYRRLTDPDGSKDQARQLVQAQIDEKNATAQKLRAEAAAAGGPGKLTEQQAKDLQYFARANAANAELAKNGLGLTGAAIGDRGQTRGVIDGLIRSVPGVGQSGVANTLVSNERQTAEQSGRELINAILRKDSGAALTDTELAEYGRTYLPQTGDGEAVLKQKQAAVTRAIQGIRDGLGSAAILAAETNRPEYKSSAYGSGQATVSTNPLRVKGPEDVMGLPSGTLFVAPDGKTRRVP